MRLISFIQFIAEDTPHQDDKGITTANPLFPEKPELIYGTLASLIVFVLLYKFAWPPLKKGLAARTERIQKELDSASTDKASAETEAANIRQAKGDIGAERERLLADARAQAAAMLADGAGRIEEEIVELNARADAEIAASKTRVFDELRAEIVRLSIAAADRAVAESLDDETQQELVEAFIQKVGASA
jgi:F-type H+-transporting ATPase subunit b